MKKMATVVAGAAMMLGLSGVAHAIPTLYLQNGSSTLTVEDNSSNDSDSTVGIITFNQKFGAFNMLNVSTGVSLQVNNFPYIDLNSVDGSTSTSSTTLLLKFSDTSFNGSTYPALGFNIGGTVAQGGSVSYAAYYDTNNTLFGTSNLIGSGSAGAGSFSYTSPNALMPTSTFSLTEVLSITHSSSIFPRITSLDAEIAPVPEPGTVLLLGAGFLGLAIYGKRRKNA